MSYDVRITPQALQDLRELYEYIAYGLSSPGVAARQVSRIEERVYALEEMSERYRAYDRKPWKDRNLRIMPVDNYLVFYIADNSEMTVTVIRILYGGRDVEPLLGKPVPADEESEG